MSSISIYTCWFNLKQRPHHLAELLLRNRHEVGVYAYRGLRSPRPALSPGLNASVTSHTLISNRLCLTDTLVRLNRDRLNKLISVFASSPSDLHIYAAPPLVLPRKPAVLIYDCMDDWSAFPNAAPGLSHAELELCELADRIWVTSRTLEERFAPRFSAKLQYVPNGVDCAHFAESAVRRAQRPNGKTIGYVGMIDDWFDECLVQQLAVRLPDWNIVLAGPVRLSRVRRANLLLPNIKLIGIQEYRKLPQIMAGFDVGIIPFKLNRLVKAVSPVKLFEYLAAGLPVVSTPLPEVAALREDGVVHCAASADEFAAAVQSCTHTDLTCRRHELADLHSWSRLFSGALPGWIASH
jgi:glycosyltransferase involved in cell wall biosynthesis